MTGPIAWMLTGAVALLVVSVLVAMVIDGRVRRDVSAALLGVIVLPVMVPATILIWAMEHVDVGARPLSNRALARFANQRQREDIDRRAWVFSLAGRGLIVVRKRPRPVWSRPASARLGGDQ